MNPGCFLRAVLLLAGGLGVFAWAGVLIFGGPGQAQGADAPADGLPWGRPAAWENGPPAGANPAPPAENGVPAEDAPPAASRAAAPPPGVSAPAARTHTVARGETPGGIVQRYGITLGDLVAANPSLGRGAGVPLSVGQVLDIPAPAPAAAPPPPPAGPAPDFSAGFERLFALGLPDTKGATWMESDTGRGTMRVNGRTLKPPPDGFFQLPGGDGLYIPAIQGAFAVTIINEQRFEEMLRTEQQKPQPEDIYQKVMRESPAQPLTVSAAPADAAAQAVLLRQWLADSADLGFNRGWMPPDALIFAAQLHRLGLTAEANALAAAIFAAHDPREVLAGALQRIAFARYLAALRRVKTEQDWPAFVAALDEILTRYGANWAQRPLVARVREAVQKQIASPPPPPLAGPEWSAEDRALAAELLADPREHFDAGWLLPLQAPAAEAREGGVSPPGAALSSRLSTLGARALPALAELARDETLLPDSDSTADSSGLGVSETLLLLEQESSERELEILWLSGFPRPKTRSEQALRVLAPVLPGEFRREMRGGEPPFEDIQKWARAAAARSPAELARSYLTAGGDRYFNLARGMAIEWFARNAEGDDAVFFETEVLAARDLTDLDEPIAAYLARRGAEGRPFAEKLLKQVDEEIAGLDAQEREYRGDQLKKFREFVADAASGKTLVQRIAELKTVQDEDWPVAYAVVQQRLARGQPGAAEVTALVEIARAKSGVARQNLLTALYIVAMSCDAAESGHAALAANMRASPDVWRMLLADGTVAAGVVDGGTLGDEAANVVLLALHPDGTEILPPQKLLMEEKLGPRQLARARRLAGQLLAGEKLTEPYLPEAVPLPSEKLAALAAAAQAGNRAAWAGGIAALSDGEYVTWLETIEKDPALAKSAAPLINVAAESSVGDPPAGAELAAWAKSAAGQPLTVAKVNELFAALALEIKAGRSGTARLQRLPDGSGWRFAVQPLDAETLRYSRYAGDTGRVQITAVLQDGGGDYASLSRAYPRGASAPEEPDEEAEKAMQMALANLLAPDAAAHSALIHIQYLPPAPAGEAAGVDLLREFP